MILSVNYKTVSPLGFQEAMINLGNQTSNTRPKKRNLCFSHLLTILILLILLNLEYVSAVAECLSGNKLKCFTCNSHQDEFCADPFNWTTLPRIQLCEGCCVKIVQGMGTSEEKVRRGCTDDLDINYFMVDHVCMTEGGGRGKMCFCEENECNSSTSLNPFPIVTLVIALMTLFKR